MVRYIDGDILSEPKQGERIIICQQVNCAGVMGAGLAKQIRAKYPVVYSEYQKYIYELTAKNCRCLGESAMFALQTISPLPISSGKMAMEGEHDIQIMLL